MPLSYLIGGSNQAGETARMRFRHFSAFRFTSKKNPL
jgi:hypothetical protein